MKYIYVDNYRGFSNAFIPIKDVNFFVGENSTGKTSIMGLLSVISSDDLWLRNEIDFHGVGFGAFRDIVSFGSEDKKSFTFGMIYDRARNYDDGDGDGDGEEIVSALFSFVEIEGMPRLHKVTLLRCGRELSILYIGGKVKYRVRDYDCNFCSEKFIEQYFSCIVKDHKFNNKGYKVFGKKESFLNGAPLMILVSFLEGTLFGDKASGEARIEQPSIFHDIIWQAPIRSKPRKTYDDHRLEYTPEGDHIPFLIKKRFDKKNDRLKEYLSSFGELSGLFDEITIKRYGQGSADPFELDVMLSQHAVSVSSVGYGVSQVLPIIVETYVRKKKSWFAIQQPEIHLHPKAQAALGDMFFKIANDHAKKFIIETHSDFLIDRYRIACRKAVENNVESQILFFERKEGRNVVTAINIDESGEVSSDQPISYREFFLKEEMNLLGL